ncbi:MAG: major facilitator superfamily 1 [Gammaproteobacteria bacterium]|jgi:maltose/moltooligosaccharide transporter|nr:major facilitator superfamily 1 [Gammaproteobacteria bacterium]
MERSQLKAWQIWSMSLGLLGINFGWGLQMANMSAIYEFLGAKPDQIPILWLAAPITGLLVQPIIGWFSDRTWCFLGRRRPYFLFGAILASLALILMPLSHSLWMAAILLWILDATVNISMGPFRALIPDILPIQQRTRAYITQGILIATGTVLASALPWVLQHFQWATHSSSHQTIPNLVKYSFWIGAAIFMVTILWTVLTTKEIPPTNVVPQKTSLKQTCKELWQDFLSMPKTMKDLAWVMMFSWAGLFCMFLFFPIAVAHQVFHAEVGSAAYQQGLAWAGMCFAFYSFIFLIVSLIMPWFANRFRAKNIYATCLTCGGLGLLGILFAHTPWQLLILMVGVGIAFSGMQSLPYAMLADALPRHKLGTYMGLFNLFIVIPEIVVSLCLGWAITYLLHGDRHFAVALGGVFMLFSAFLVKRVRSAPAAKLEECRNAA